VGLLLAAALACKGDAPTERTGFQLTVSAEQPMIIARGTSRTIQVTITRTSGFTGSVGLKLADANQSVTADPTTITADQNTADFVIHVSSGAPLGLNDVTIEGTATGFAVVQLPVQISVPGNGSFSMAVGAYPAFVLRNQTFHVPVNILRTDYAGSVTLSLEQPSNFVMVIAQPGTGDVGDISFTVGPTVPIGSSYTIRLTASGPGATPQDAVILFAVTQGS